MNPEITEPEESTPTTNAVSLFGQGGGPNDFPVLKAFQQYIDAEQAKARKRMLGLSVFFIVLLVVIVITFTLVVMSVINRNQTLSDRLLDIALRDKISSQPVVNVQSPPSPVVQHAVEPAEIARLRDELQRQKEERQAEQAQRDKEKIDSLTAALAKAQQPVAPTPVVVTTSPAPVVQPTAESAELARLREELRREKEERKAEQAKRDEEKKKAEKEAFLRRQYPDYYAREDARKAAEAEAARRVPSSPSPTVIPPSPAVIPASPAVIPPSPTVIPPSPPAPQTKAFSALPPEDPELAELLKNLKTAPKKPVPQPHTQAVAEPKPAPQPAAKPTPPPAAKPAAKPTPPPAVKPIAKPTPPPAVKPIAKPAPPPAQISTPPAQHTETLAIGGGDGKSIPWLIEIPQN